METSTATNASASPKARARTETKKTGRNVWLRRSRELALLASKPVVSIWDGYLREPVAKGLIITGVILTETGRFVRKAGASNSSTDSNGEKVLH